MLNKTIIALGLGLMAVGAMQAPAQAGGAIRGGYDPLWWNGPAGYNYTDLFESKGYLSPSFGPSYSRRGGCAQYERNYLDTGKRIWLRKYELCRAG